MKQLITCIVLMLTGLLAHAQLNDLDLANKLIGEDVKHLDSIIRLSGYEYTVTDIFEDEKSFTSIYTMYIESQHGGIKLWELRVKIPSAMVGNPGEAHKKQLEGKSGYISDIFIEYQNSNVGDLRDFKSYEISANDSITYTKEMGKNLSYLKVMYLRQY